MLIKKIFNFDKIIDIAEKSITDKDEKNKLISELNKIELESDIKIQELVNGRLGSFLEKCVSIVFPLVGFIFSFTLLTNIILHIILFYKGQTTSLIEIDKELYTVMLSYIVGFFGNRSVKEFTKNKIGGEK